MVHTLMFQLRVSSGTNGSGLTVNFTIASNAISAISIANPGEGYDTDSVVDVTGHTSSGGLNALRFNVTDVTAAAGGMLLIFRQAVEEAAVVT